MSRLRSVFGPLAALILILLALAVLPDAATATEAPKPASTIVVAPSSEMPAKAPVKAREPDERSKETIHLRALALRRDCRRVTTRVWNSYLKRWSYQRQCRRPAPRK